MGHSRTWHTGWMTTADRPDLAERSPARAGRPSFVQVVLALRSWNRKQVLTAAAATVAIALLMGGATVRIPNSLFLRDIPPVWWDYPVWLLTSLLAGLPSGASVRTRRSESRRVG